VISDELPFLLATGNLHKAREIVEILVDITGVPMTTHAVGGFDETSAFLVHRPEELVAFLDTVQVPKHLRVVEEVGETLEENARLKAGELGKAWGMISLADDTGLEVDVLGGAPGVHTARYAGESAGDDKNNQKLLNALKGIPPEQRKARFVTVVVLRREDESEEVARGVVEGMIVAEPRGSGGFGYDPLFCPFEGDGRTFAQMASTEKHHLSHRGRAVRALVASMSRRERS